MNKNLIRLGVVMALGIGLYWFTKGGREAAAFEGVLKQYGTVRYPAAAATSEGTMPWRDGAVSLSPDQLPPRTGKILVVRPRYDAIPPHFQERLAAEREEQTRIDPVWFELDSSIRAKTPDEVGTLVQAEWGRTSVNVYSQGGQGSVREAVPIGAKSVFLTIYDMKSQVLVGRWLLEGETPPPTMRSLNETEKLRGPPLAAFLKAMPAR